MLKFHLTGAGLIVGAVILAVDGLPLVAALALYCAVSTPKESIMVNRAEELIADLEAEIVKRDARIAELEAESAEWSPVMQRLGDENQSLRAALKSQQPSAGVVLPERMTCDDGYPSDDWLIASAHNRCLDEVARLNPCRAQAVPDDLRAAAENCSFVMRYIGSMEPDEIDGDNVELRFEDEDGRDTGADASIVEYAEKVADLLDAMLAAAPSTKKESGDE